MFDAVIFDCDGVLVDSEVLALEIECATLAEFGVATEREAYAARFMGLDNKGWLAALEADYPSVAARLEEYEARTKALYYAALERRLAAIAGAHDAIGAVAGPKAVASSSGAHSLALKLTRTGLWDLFAPHVYSTDLVAAGKPSPDIFLHAAEQLAVNPARCLVIEDSRNGVRAGRAAGMTVWGFTGGGHCFPASSQALLDAGAARVLTSWDEAQRDFSSWSA